MPELPEVEAVKNGLNLRIKNTAIKKVKVHNKNLRWPVAPGFSRAVTKAGGIVEVSRRAKYLVFDLGEGCIVNHLGMTGIWKMKPTAYSLEKHDHVELICEDGLRLIYNDPRRFGMMNFYKDPEDFFKHKEFGPEPLSRSFNGNSLFSVLQSKSAPVKNVIMNQKIVLGIGNIYACEALFLSGIHPSRPSSKVSKAEASLLVKNSKKVLRQAIKAGGSSIKDFRTAGGESGYFQKKFFVYGREGQKCYVCKKEVIKNLKLAGRSSFYCSKCQT